MWYERFVSFEVLFNKSFDVFLDVKIKRYHIFYVFGHDGLVASAYFRWLRLDNDNRLCQRADASLVKKSWTFESESSEKKQKLHLLWSTSVSSL